MGKTQLVARKTLIDFIAQRPSLVHSAPGLRLTSFPLIFTDRLLVCPRLKY